MCEWDIKIVTREKDADKEREKERNIIAIILKKRKEEKEKSKSKERNLEFCKNHSILHRSLSFSYHCINNITNYEIDFVFTNQLVATILTLVLSLS